MASKQAVRDVTPFLRKVRAVLMGRDPRLNNRWPVQQAARDQPPPNLPGGCSHKLNSNYYFTRDGRRLVTPNLVVAVNSSASSNTLLLGTAAAETPADGKETAVALTQKKPKTPNAVYNPPCELNL